MTFPTAEQSATLTTTGATTAIPVTEGQRVAIAVRGTFTATVTPQMFLGADTVGYDFGADTIAGAGATAVSTIKQIIAPCSGRIGAAVTAFTAGSIGVKVRVGG